MATTALNNPLLYERTSDDRSSMGLGHVPGLLTATVTSTYDQVPQLTLTYEFSQEAVELLQPDRILVVDAGDDWSGQMFRIDSSETSWSDEKEITVVATHVSGDLFGNLLLNDISLANANPSEAFSKFLDSLAEPMPISITSSISDVAIINWSMSDNSSAQDLMFGRDDSKPSFTSIYKAEWWFDNYSFRLEHNVGRDNGIVIKPGKNLISYQNSNSLDGVFTAVRPFAKYTPGASSDTGDESNIKPLSGIGMVQWVGSGGLPVYDTPFKDHNKTGKELKLGSRWKIYSYIETGAALDHTWYNVGGNQWIDGQYITFDKGNTSQIQTVGNKVIGIGSIIYNIDNEISKRQTETLPGVLTIQYLGKGGVAIWTTPWANKAKTGKYLVNGKSYKLYKKATDYQDHVWYNLGGAQWIDEQYITFDKSRDYMINNAMGVGTVKIDKGKVAIWSEPTQKSGVVKYVSNKQRYKIYGIGDNQSTTWYNLGGNQWIDSQYLDFSDPRDVEPKEQTDNREDSPQVAGKVPVYTQPGDWNPTTGKYLASGTQWKIYGQASAGGDTWYDLGNNQWIKAEWMTFEHNTDVEPSGDNDDTSQEVAEVTVTLPEKYVSVLAPNGHQYEHQRIQDFDASEYGVTDEDSLRQVTQAYIHDQSIGEPKISMTFDYAELSGEFASLTRVRLYDQVTVYVPELDINMTAEVTATTYDVLLQQNTSVTVGTRPKIISDELATWQKKAEAAADKEAAANQKKIDDMDLAWQKDIDQVNTDVGNVKRSIADQASWIESFKQQVDDDINSYKDYIGNQVADLNQLKSIVKYDSNAVSFYLPNGTKVGSLGAGGLVYNAPDGTIKSVVSASGHIVADEIVGNKLTGTTIHGAEFTGGTVTALDYFSAKSGNGLTVISGDWGLSTTMGIHASNWSRFDADVLVSGSLTVGQKLNLNSNATSFLRMNPSDGLLYFHGGMGFSHDYQVVLKEV